MNNRPKRMKNENIQKKYFNIIKIVFTFEALNKDGGVAQLVEQRTENPCVGGSIPSLTTPEKH